MAKNDIVFEVLVQGVEKIKSSFDGVAQSLEKFSKTTKELGRELSQVGSTVGVLGAAISGPLVLALNATAKSSVEVAAQTKRLHQITSDFQKDIAQAVLPVFEKFVNIVDTLFKAFERLDEGMRNQILQGALLTGVFLTISGALILIAGKVLGLASNLAGLAAKFLVFAAANPLIIAVGGSILILITLMVKFKAVADVVANTFEILFRTLEIGFQTAVAGMSTFVALSLKGISKVLSGLAAIPGPSQRAFTDMANAMENASSEADILADKSLFKVKEAAQEIGNILISGEGTWSVGIDELKTKFEEFIGSFNAANSGESPVQGFFAGFKQGLDEIKVKVTDLQAIGQSLAQSLQTNLSTAFSNIILGVTDARTAFAEFGKAAIKSVVDFVSQWIAFQLLSKAFMVAAQVAGIAMATTLGAVWAPVAAFVTLATVGANVIPAQVGIGSTVALAQLLAVPRFAAGSGGMKDDTLGLFNKREIVLPGSFSDAIKSGELTLSGPGGGDQGGIVVDLRGSQINGITDSLVEQIFNRASENLTNRTLAFRRA